MYVLFRVEGVLEKSLLQTTMIMMTIVAYLKSSRRVNKKISLRRHFDRDIVVYLKSSRRRREKT